MCLINFQQLRDGATNKIEIMLEKLKPHEGFSWAIDDDPSIPLDSIRVCVTEKFPSEKEHERDKVIVYDMVFPAREKLSSGEICEIYLESTNWLAGLPDRRHFHQIDWNALIEFEGEPAGSKKKQD
ncbi:MAG: hypothetical protein WC227_01845 [Patescibacteria group bacterium]|jgi:hypothetical protein